MKKTKEKPKRAIAYGEGSSKKSLKGRRQKMNSERTVKLSEANLLAAVEAFMFSMRLIDPDERISWPKAADTYPGFEFTVVKEVLN